MPKHVDDAMGQCDLEDVATDARVDRSQHSKLNPKRQDTEARHLLSTSREEAAAANAGHLSSRRPEQPLVP
jgi:hypothetical protein